MMNPYPNVPPYANLNMPEPFPEFNSGTASGTYPGFQDGVPHSHIQGSMVDCHHMYIQVWDICPHM